MTWKYRIVHRAGRYAIHEVFYDEQGDVWTCTEEPVAPVGETLEELREDLEHYRQAFDLPVLEYEDLVPDAPVDVEEAY